MAAAELSTSARLRQVEAENAHLRGDFRRVLAERNEALNRVADLEQLCAATNWIVARDGGRYCERCEGEVRRGEAYELEPGSGGLLLHIRCPRATNPQTEATDG